MSTPSLGDQAVIFDVPCIATSIHPPPLPLVRSIVVTPIPPPFSCFLGNRHCLETNSLYSLLDTCHVLCYTGQMKDVVCNIVTVCFKVLQAWLLECLGFIWRFTSNKKLDCVTSV